MKSSVVRITLLALMSLVFIVTFANRSVFAAVTNPSDVTTLITSMTPEFPKALDAVTIKVTSYGTDLQRSIIRWYVNGKLQKEGAAVTEFSVGLGSYGSITKVKVQVLSGDGRIFEKNLTISPSDLSLVWQADTYTPPFYKGKRLYSNSSDLIFMAIPSGKYDTKSIVFTWKQDADVLQASSGLGKNIITIPGNLITREKIITVDAVSTDGLFIARQSILMKPTFPQVIAYEDNAVHGVRFESAIRNNTVVKTDEFKIAAFPYYFSTKNRFLKDVSFTWGIGSNTLGGTQAKSTITLKRDASVSNALLSIGARHSSKILQDTTTSALLNFAPNN